jgi:putative tryptophan/tyrosine transport system substrate-binding protein
MRRREFISLLCGAVAARPLAVRAQQTGQMRRIGVLVNLPERDSQTKVRLDIFRQNLAQLGWLEGQNVRIQYRYSAITMEQSEAEARELIDLQPDVVLGHGIPAVTALRRTTRSIPIVFIVVAEPVALGFADSLSHPGGNITGFSHLEPSLGAKWLELLKAAAPAVACAAILFNPDTAPSANLFIHSAQDSASKLGVELIESPVHDLVGLEDAIAPLAREPGIGLIILPDVFTGAYRQTIFERAAYYRLPAIYPFPNYAVEGGLISYGADIEDLYRRAATYVDRILRGDKPSDLPVQQPTKYELTINLKTAKALGLEVAPSLLAFADKVIE